MKKKMMTSSTAVLAIFLILLLSISFSDGNLIKSTKSVARFKKENLKLTPFEIKSESHVRDISFLSMRGGKAGTSIKGKKTEGIVKKTMEFIGSIQPITRIYLLLSAFCTLVHLSGLPAPKYFALNPRNIFELWRPFTSVAYFGPLSMSMANSMFFLLRYGQTLEQEYGSGTHAWFLFTQIVILTLLGFLLSFPFQAQAMIAAILYVCSRLNPMESVLFQFGFVISSWQLPFCMMLIDCLSQQTISAAWPHLLGIFSGHFYYFLTVVWPKLGGKEYLKTPKLFFKLFGDKPKSNIEGLKGSTGSNKKKRSSSSSLFNFFSRKKSPGKKID